MFEVFLCHGFLWNISHPNNASALFATQTMLAAKRDQFVGSCFKTRECKFFSVTMFLEGAESFYAVDTYRLGDHVMKYS